jgi:hypothetical protein
LPSPTQLFPSPETFKAMPKPKAPLHPPQPTHPHSCRARPLLSYPPHSSHAKAPNGFQVPHPCTHLDAGRAQRPCPCGWFGQSEGSPPPRRCRCRCPWVHLATCSNCPARRWPGETGVLTAPVGCLEHTLRPQGGCCHHQPGALGLALGRGEQPGVGHASHAWLQGRLVEPPPPHQPLWSP